MASSFFFGIAEQGAGVGFYFKCDDGLKDALIQCTTASEQQLLTAEELGDRKPSQLRRMQQLLGDRADNLDNSLIRELFLQSLPNYVRIILTSSDTTYLEALARMADKIMEVGSPALYATHQVLPTHQVPPLPNDMNSLRSSTVSN
ncbi:uncharacterized protein ISCGN_024062 [Ixodes scapularis]